MLPMFSALSRTIQASLVFSGTGQHTAADMHVKRMPAVLMTTECIIARSSKSLFGPSSLHYTNILLGRKTHHEDRLESPSGIDVDDEVDIFHSCAAKQNFWLAIVSHKTLWPNLS